MLTGKAWSAYLADSNHGPLDRLVPDGGPWTLFGAPDAMQCGLSFFGADHVLFSSDMPFDPEKGPSFIRASIRDVESLPLSAGDREKIFAGNARRLLHL